MAKKRVGKVPTVFRQRAVEQLTPCEHIVEFAKELGLRRRLWSGWREKREALDWRGGTAGACA